MDSYKITFETWNKVATAYQEKFMDLDLYDDTYDAFCSQVEKPGATILEIGCGPGNITRYLLAKRPDLNIEGIDIAPNMIALAAQNNPNAKFTIMDCREIDRLPGKYDGIVCGFCMPYLSKEDVSKFIKDCALLLNVAGILYFSTIAGDYRQSGFKTASTGDSCYLYYYSEAYLLELLEQNGFENIVVTQKEYPQTNAANEVDLILTAKLQ